MKIEIYRLNPHPYNSRIYGYTDNTELIQRITESGWVKPILITQNNTIISGHRRVEACKKLGIQEIECEVVSDNPIVKLELLVAENCYRIKTTSQLMKESEIYFDIEKKKSNQRMMSRVNPETNLSQGRTTEIVAEKIGMGESTFKKGKKVMGFIENHPDYQWFFENTMDLSVDKSLQMTEKPIEFLEKVIEKVAGEKNG